MEEKNDEINYSLIRANLDIEFLKENALTLKNYLIDQAGLLKALELKSENLKRVECENRKLKSEFINIKEYECSLPTKIEELEETITNLNNKLKSQELINEQVKYNNENNNERNIWNIEKKNSLLKINERDRQISTLKIMYEQLSNKTFATERLNDKNIREEAETYEKIVDEFKLKIKRKNKKIKKRNRELLKKYLEFEKLRKKYKKLKKRTHT